MGKSQRKTSKYLELYRKIFKRKVSAILEFTPPFTSKEAFLKLFEEVYPDDAQSMKKHYQFYQEKNKTRRTGKPLYFPYPAQLLCDIAGSALTKIKEADWNESEAENKKILAIADSKKEQEKRNSKYLVNNISTQNVIPEYINSLIKKYWFESDKLQRLYIVQECAKYKHADTIHFLRHVLHGEKDWFIRNASFRTLQKFDEVVYLPQKGKGKRSKYNTLVNMIGADYKEDIGKAPADILSEYNDKKYIQTLKSFDVFISHCMLNDKIVNEIVGYLNNIGMVAFVDWKSDRHDLARSKYDEYTSEALKLRMQQSSSLLLIRTSESDQSTWVSWELRYFSGLNKKIAVLEAEDNLVSELEYLSGYPKVLVKDDELHVLQNNTIYKFPVWLKTSNP